MDTTNPLAEKRRLRKLANKRLEEEARRRQQEQQLAQERERQRVELERGAAQQQAANERERIQRERQAECDRIARLEQHERDVIERVETQLCSVGAVCVGELKLPYLDALPLSVAVLAPNALEAPIANADDSASLVLVADDSGLLHAFALDRRAPVFSANFVCDQRRPGCLVVDLHVLFGQCRGSSDDPRTLKPIDGTPAVVHFFGDDSTEASGHLASPRGIAFDDTASELFVSDQLSHCVNVYAFTPDPQSRVASKSKVTRPMTRAIMAFSRTFGTRGHGAGQLQQPSGLDISHYHVVVSDVGNNRLAVFAKRGSFVTAIGRKGTGDGEFHDVRDVKLLNVRKRAISRGLQLTDNTVANEQFEIVVADLGNFRIQVLNESGEFLRQLSLLSNGQHIAFQRDKLSALATLLLHENAALGGAASTDLKLTMPPSLSGHAMSELYKLAERLHPRCSARELAFVDRENANVVICNADGSRTTWLRLAQKEERSPRISSVHSTLQLSVECKANESSSQPEDPPSTSKQARLYVSDPQSHRIAVFEGASLAFLFYIGATTYGDQTQCASGFLPGELRHPTFLASFSQADSDTATRSPVLVVSDTGNHSISLFDAWTGEFCGRIGEGFGHLESYFDSPHGVAVLEDRLLYVCDQRNHRVQEFDLSTCSFVRAFGREGGAVGEFSYPVGVAVSSALPTGDPKCDFGPHRDAKVVVGDTGNHRVQVFAAADLQVLMVLRVDATPLDQPLVPTGVSVEPRSGSVLVCDAANKCVVVFGRGGSFLASFGATVEPANRFDRPMSVVKSACGGQLLVADAGRCDVCSFDLR